METCHKLVLGTSKEVNGMIFFANHPYRHLNYEYAFWNHSLAYKFQDQEDLLVVLRTFIDLRIKEYTI